MPSQKITPFLWFDTQAEEAAQFYTSIFKDSKINSISRYGDGMPMPKGSVMTVGFTSTRFSPTVSILSAYAIVAPQPIENALKTSPYILNAMVVGDRRKFIVALLVPNATTVAAKAADQGIKFASNAELAAHPWVHALVDSEVKRLTVHLAQYETIKRFALLPEDFTFDNGGLTFTLKLKRRVVEQQYAAVIESLYADVAEPRPILQN